MFVENKLAEKKKDVRPSLNICREKETPYLNRELKHKKTRSFVLVVPACFQMPGLFANISPRFWLYQKITVLYW